MIGVLAACVLAGSVALVVGLVAWAWRQRRCARRRFEAVWGGLDEMKGRVESARSGLARDRLRPIGLAKGSFEVPPGINDLLPPDVQAGFEGSDEGHP